MSTLNDLTWKNDQAPALNDTNLNILTQAIKTAVDTSNAVAGQFSDVKKKIDAMGPATDYLTYDEGNSQFVVNNKFNLYALISAFSDSLWSDNDKQIQKFPNASISIDSTNTSLIATEEKVDEKVRNHVLKNFVFQHAGQIEAGGYPINISTPNSDRVVIHLSAPVGSDQNYIDLPNLSVCDNNSSRKNLISIADTVDNINTYTIEINRIVNENNSQYYIIESLYNEKGYGLRRIERIDDPTTNATLNPISVIHIENDSSGTINYNIIAEGVHGGQFSTLPNFGESTFTFPEYKEKEGE